MIAEALHESRYTLIDGLHALGGWRDYDVPTVEQTFSARYNIDPTLHQGWTNLGFNLEAEILNALWQELGAETSLKLLCDCAQIVDTHAKPVTPFGVMEAIDRLAEELPGDCLVIGSPRSLLFSPMKKRRWPHREGLKEFLSSRLLALQYYGQRGKFTFLINPYADDSDPVLVLASGWFGFNYDRVLWTEEETNAMTQETSTRFHHDIHTNIDATRVRKLSITI